MDLERMHRVTNFLQTYPCRVPAYFAPNPVPTSQSVVIFSANSVHLSILCIICYRQRESIVTCEIVVIPMNSRSIVLTCIKVFYYSIIVFVHLIFFNICKLSFNRDFAHS